MRSKVRNKIYGENKTFLQARRVFQTGNRILLDFSPILNSIDVRFCTLRCLASDVPAMLTLKCCSVEKSVVWD